MEVFQAWMIDTRSASTALNKHKGLQQFFQWLLVDEQAIDRTPMERVHGSGSRCPGDARIAYRIQHTVWFRSMDRREWRWFAVDGPGTVADRVRALVAAHSGDRGALLPILHRIQAEFGYVDQNVVPVLAAELNLSRADVHGVITFYSDFRSEPAGRTVVKLCRGEACQSVGAEQLVAHVEQVLGIKLGQTTPDGSVTLEQVFCLGNCALGPAGQINERVQGRLSPSRLDALLVTEAERA
ncbi:formate dehydrogenase subunit gamma [Micromonospora sp. CA-259024]|uniref:formate dehydrogenase subunit gamma n=1 Tax=Micromonospora sp. CA-259024 TaxID=3239965 RepID=UPI003D8AD98A